MLVFDEEELTAIKKERVLEGVSEEEKRQRWVPLSAVKYTTSEMRAQNIGYEPAYGLMSISSCWVGATVAIDAAGTPLRNDAGVME